jgi:hypothetical protein
MFVASLGWNPGAALTPYIALAVGAPFLLIRIFHVARAAFGIGTETMSSGQIMDIGFRIGEDPEAEHRRFAMIVGAIAVLYLGLWVVGFHVMLPLWTLLYMHFIGRVRPIWSVTVTVLMIAFLVGIYDYLLHAVWNEPLILKLFS